MIRKNTKFPTIPSNWSKPPKVPKGKQQKVKSQTFNCHEKLETEQAEPNQRRTEERRKVRVRTTTGVLHLWLLLR